MAGDVELNILLKLLVCSKKSLKEESQFKKLPNFSEDQILF